jgi:transcriptional regulator with XRE-family HTH domain
MKTVEEVFMRTTPPMPLPVKRSLSKLGADIRAARQRRRITMTLMAERAFVARSTLQKVEQGDPGVSVGVYATVLFILGLSQRIADLADISTDSVGLQLDEERLPKRVRTAKRASVARP